jgi:hypothetical protein
MLEYLRDNECTDGALGIGVEIIANSYSSDQLYLTYGYWFAIAGCVASVLIFLTSIKNTDGPLEESKNKKSHAVMEPMLYRIN